VPHALPARDPLQHIACRLSPRDFLRSLLAEPARPQDPPARCNPHGPNGSISPTRQAALSNRGNAQRLFLVLRKQKRDFAGVQVRTSGMQTSGPTQPDLAHIVGATPKPAANRPTSWRFFRAKMGRSMTPLIPCQQRRSAQTPTSQRKVSKARSNSGHNRAMRPVMETSIQPYASSSIAAHARPKHQAQAASLSPMLSRRAWLKPHPQFLLQHGSFFSRLPLGFI